MSEYPTCTHNHCPREAEWTLIYTDVAGDPEVVHERDVCGICLELLKRDRLVLYVAQRPIVERRHAPRPYVIASPDRVV